MSRARAASPRGSQRRLKKGARTPGWDSFKDEMEREDMSGSNSFGGAFDIHPCSTCGYSIARYRHRVRLRTVRAVAHGALHFVSMGLHDESPFKLVFQVTGHSAVLQAEFEVNRENSFFDIAYSRA